MYNAAQKEQFIREYTTKISVRTQAKSLFEAVEPYEEQRQADLCTWSVEELQQVFDKVTGIRESSRSAPRTILMRYGEWCVKNRIPGATDAARQLDRGTVENLRSRMIRNPRHLQSVLDLLCEPESEETADNCFRTWFWLVYAGMKDTDIPNVRTSDVDFERMSVRYGCREYPFCREALPAIRNCVRLQEFRYKHPLYPEHIIWMDRVPGDILVRSVRSVPSVHTMQVDLSRRLKKARDAGKTDMQLSYYKIWLSGAFYRMWEEELAGFPVDFSSFVDEKLGDFQYSVKPGGSTQETKRKSLAKSYQSDYERWKQALTL